MSNAGSATKIAGNTVEVSEDVPFGLTITSMSGAGWSCPSPGGLPICTRTDLLSPGASYPPIIVLADVAMNAVSPLFNGATVILSGQSESEYGNNFAVDQATIVGSPIPTLGMWALWMLVLAGSMVVQKNVRWGRSFARGTALVLGAAGVAIAAGWWTPALRGLRAVCG